MTLTERIDSALKEPIDQELMDLAKSQVKIKSGHECRAIYTLLLERKALLAQVEAESTAENHAKKTIGLMHSWTPEQRLDFIGELESNFCRHCGIEEIYTQKCQCWNDE
jgi:hypothetical protein